MDRQPARAVPDNPFTTGAEFVANGLVWLARHASGDLPGLHSMDSAGDLIGDLQAPPSPRPDAYSALVASYNPTGDVLTRMLDTGIDQFFGSAKRSGGAFEGGWRVDHGDGMFIPAARIACYGPGGNLAPDSVTHVNFFPHQQTVDFLVTALSGQARRLPPVDPDKALPDRRLIALGESGHNARPLPRRARPARARRLPPSRRGHPHPAPSCGA